MHIRQAPLQQRRVPPRRFSGAHLKFRPVQPEILLTLSAGSIRPLLSDPQAFADAEVKLPRNVFELPDFVATDLQLRGLNLPTDLLKGFGLPEVDKLRDAADRAHCPVLLLFEEPAIDFTERGANWAKSVERLRRLGLAANRLGCPSIAVRATAADTDAALEATAAGVKMALKELDKFDLNLLLAPHEGLTHSAARLTDLIKKIGGFRIGSYPSFAHAYATGDLENTLRKLAPYAPAIAASVRGFDAKTGEHDGYSLESCVDCVRSVGYGNTLALDFVGRGADEPGAKKTSKKAAKVDIIGELLKARAQLEAATSEPELALDEEEE
jgi:hypothetical protein